MWPEHHHHQQEHLLYEVQMPKKFEYKKKKVDTV